MDKFQPGDRVRRIPNGSLGTILGPEDFEGYDFNRPDQKWELVRWDKLIGKEKIRETWCGNIWLEKIHGQV